MRVSLTENPLSSEKTTEECESDVSRNETSDRQTDSRIATDHCVAISSQSQPVGNVGCSQDDRYDARSPSLKSTLSQGVVKDDHVESNALASLFVSRYPSFQERVTFSASPTSLNSNAEASHRDQQVVSSVALCMKSIKECVTQFFEQCRQHISVLKAGLINCELGGRRFRERHLTETEAIGHHLSVRSAESDDFANHDDTDIESFTSQEQELLDVSNRDLMGYEDAQHCNLSNELFPSMTPREIKTRSISRLLNETATTKNDSQDTSLKFDVVLPLTVSFVERQLNVILKSLGPLTEKAIQVIATLQKNCREAERKYALQNDVVDDLEKQLHETRALSTVNHNLEQKIANLQKENDKLLRLSESPLSLGSSKFTLDAARKSSLDRRLEEDEIQALKAEIRELSGEITELRQGYRDQPFSDQERAAYYNIFSEDNITGNLEEYKALVYQCVASDPSIIVSDEEVLSFYAKFKKYLKDQFQVSGTTHPVHVLEHECFALWMRTSIELPVNTPTVNRAAGSPLVTQDTTLQEALQFWKDEAKRLQTEQECMARVANTRLEEFQQDLVTLTRAYVRSTSHLPAETASVELDSLLLRLSPASSGMLRVESQEEQRRVKQNSLLKSAETGKDTSRNKRPQPPRRLYQWRLQNYVAAPPVAMLTGRLPSRPDTEPTLVSSLQAPSGTGMSERSSSGENGTPSSSFAAPLLQWLNGGR